jgi:hypothetical protein
VNGCPIPLSYWAGEFKAVRAPWQIFELILLETLNLPLTYVECEFIHMEKDFQGTCPSDRVRFFATELPTKMQHHCISRSIQEFIAVANWVCDMSSQGKVVTWEQFFDLPWQFIYYMFIYSFILVFIYSTIFIYSIPWHHSYWDPNMNKFFALATQFNPHGWIGVPKLIPLPFPDYSRVEHPLNINSVLFKKLTGASGDTSALISSLAAVEYHLKCNNWFAKLMSGQGVEVIRMVCNRATGIHHGVHGFRMKESKDPETIPKLMQYRELQLCWERIQKARGYNELKRTLKPLMSLPLALENITTDLGGALDYVHLHAPLFKNHGSAMITDTVTGMVFHIHFENADWSRVKHTKAFGHPNLDCSDFLMWRLSFFFL